MNRRHLTLVHQRHLATLRSRTADSLTATWDRLGYYDSASADEFVPIAVATVTAATRMAADQTTAYVREYLNRPIAPPDPASLTLDVLRRGTSPDAVYRRPFGDVWQALHDGIEPTVAIARGRARLDMTAQTDVQLAVRAAGTLMGADKSNGIRSWTRVADGTACDLCAGADGEQIDPGDEWALHPFCGCTAAPSDEPPDGNADGSDPAAFDVHTHDELGPVLYAAGDSFEEAP